MKNRDKLIAMTDDELSDLLCKTMEDISELTNRDYWCCDICPVKELCKKGHNGFLAWLEKEAEE
jgi:hypothetical protein